MISFNEFDQMLQKEGRVTEGILDRIKAGVQGFRNQPAQAGNVQQVQTAIQKVNTLLNWGQQVLSKTFRDMAQQHNIDLKTWNRPKPNMQTAAPTGVTPDMVNQGQTGFPDMTSQFQTMRKEMYELADLCDAIQEKYGIEGIRETANQCYLMAELLGEGFAPAGALSGEGLPEGGNSALSQSLASYSRKRKKLKPGQYQTTQQPQADPYYPSTTAMAMVPAGPGGTVATAMPPSATDMANTGIRPELRATPPPLPMPSTTATATAPSMAGMTNAADTGNPNAAGGRQPLSLKGLFDQLRGAMGELTQALQTAGMTG